MDPLLINRKIDLVDFDSFKAFMFKDDNLYNTLIADERKNKDISEYYKQVNSTGFIKQLNFSADFLRKPSNIVYVFLQHLILNDVKFTSLDLGAHVGIFSLKCASFFRNISHQGAIISFDPTHAGALVDYNIRINGLEKYIKHEMIAISERGGIMNITYNPKHSDASKLTSAEGASVISLYEMFRFFIKASLKSKVTFLNKIISKAGGVIFKRNDEYSLLVESVNIVDYLNKNKIDSNLFIKIDIEGFDKRIIHQIMPVLSERVIGIITEFVSYNDPNAVKYLQYLSQYFYILDIGYAPSPFKCERIDENKFEEFAQGIVYRKFGYTDILLISKRTPSVNDLLAKFNNIVSMEEQYML